MVLVIVVVEMLEIVVVVSVFVVVVTDVTVCDVEVTVEVVVSSHTSPKNPLWQSHSKPIVTSPLPLLSPLSVTTFVHVPSF